ncbi:Hint domain-containing protein [Pseudooceanicola aestuarii]|uniref:Hint domain-containing protein n=1 Tax=Pseudooceanicola aestuarii TaxID=2697319 RepID=UPI0013D0687D|nr:Hint domain-containing protein [Pseudooceanicola aestuarii]
MTKSHNPRDGIVQGTDGNDRIDGTYSGDPQGDRIDANDAVSPSTGNEDFVIAGAGQDTVLGQAADDTIHGGSGYDDLYGGAGDDAIYGDRPASSAPSGNASAVTSAIDSYPPNAYDDDLIEGGSGNDRLFGDQGEDTVHGGADNDTIYGNAGDDSLTGGAGDDVIHGDDGEDGGAAGDRVVFSWTDLPDTNGSGTLDGEEVLTSATLNTGNVQVDYTITHTNKTPSTKFVTDRQNVEGLDAGAEHCSSLESRLDSKNESATYEWGFSAGVTDLAFRVNDVDHNSKIWVKAWGADGEPVDIQIDTGRNITTLDGNGSDGEVLFKAGASYGSDDDDYNSVLVNIPGPVTKLEILHKQDGNSTSEANITDLFFNEPSVATGEDGNDVLEGGSGDDALYGDGGDDTLTGGSGEDHIVGGDDADVIRGGNVGDYVDGSEGGDDNDTLDLTGAGPLTVAYDVDNNENGTVTFYDADGKPTGTMRFENIENVLTDNDDPDAMADTATTDEDTPVTIDVLDNDGDSNPGDVLKVESVTDGANGTVAINADGTVTYTPDDDFNGEDSFTYTVSDGNGGTDTASVTVTVTPVNDDPVGNDDTASTGYQTAVVVPVLGNDTDVDGDTLSVASFDAISANGGTVALDASGGLRFTPADGFSGSDSFSYTVSDGAGGTDTAVVRITVDKPALDGIVEGTDGDDTIDIGYTGDPEGDRIDANDALDPTSGDDDLVEAYGGDDEITAGAGDDTVYGGAGSDTVLGQSGDDLIDTRDGNVPLNDYVTFPAIPVDGAPDDDRDSVMGGIGNDTIITGDDADTIYGGDGDDHIDGGLDADEIYGGAGNDTIDGSLSTDIPGLPGAGTLGSDYIEGGSGDDSIVAGIDAFSDYVGDDPKFPLFGFDSDPNTMDGMDTVLGGEGNDTIITGDDADTIYGGSGEDSINAGIDDDYVEGGKGADVIIGSHGSDEIHGNSGDDVIDASNDTFDYSNAPDIDGDKPVGDPVQDNDLDTVYGGAGNDLIRTGDDDDMLYGGSGDDTLEGGIDEDTLYGGEGTDSIYGGGGQDRIFGADVGEFIDGGSSGDDYDILDLTGSAPDGGRIEIEYDADPEDGTLRFFGSDGLETGTARFEDIEKIIPCFTPGTLIATPRGEVPVEALQEGDRIITRDNGLQQIRWIGRKDLHGQDMLRLEHLQPVLIQKGSLGHGLPESDMLVSPNHRVLINNDKTALYFEDREVLVAAKHLTGLKGVDRVETSSASYIHFMFDQHECVLSNGSWTESFQPGELTLDGMGQAQRNEIFDLFPELSERHGQEAYKAARRTLKKHEAVLLAR